MNSVEKGCLTLRGNSGFPNWPPLLWMAWNGRATASIASSVGLTERACKEQGIKYKTGSYQLKAHGKAIATGHTEGLVKVITSEPYGEIIGCHIIGADASELIAEMGLAKRLEATAEDIISTMHAHPTMHEALHDAALGTEGRMIHG